MVAQCAANCAAIRPDLNKMDEWRHTVPPIVPPFVQIIMKWTNGGRIGNTIFSKYYVPPIVPPFVQILMKWTIGGKLTIDRFGDFFPIFAIFTDPDGGKICRAAHAATRYF